MSFERLFESPIPLHEAAAYFMKLKYANDGTMPAASAPPQDPSSAGMPDVGATMAEVARLKLQLALAYRVYSESLRDPANTALGEHFKEHADQELEHADYFIRRMAVLQNSVELGAIEPPVSSTELTAILSTLMEGEKNTIAALQELHQLVGENPMKYEIESMMSLDQHHYDDLMQHMSGGTEVDPGGPTATPQKTANQGMPQLPETAMGQQKPVPQLPALSGAAAGQLPKMAFAVTSEGHKFDAEKAKIEKEYALDRVRLLQKYDAAHGHLDAKGKAQMPKVLSMLRFNPAAIDHLHNARRQDYIARKHEEGSNAWNPFGGVFTPVKEEVGDNGLFRHRVKDKTASVGRLLTAAEIQKRANLEVDPETAAYLEEEQAAQQAMEENSMGYYRNRFSSALEELEATKAQMAEQQEQIQQLQGQLAEAEQQSQSLMAQSQQTNDMATQTAQQAHAVASQAVQTNLQTNQELIQQMQLSANMRNAIDQMKQQMMQVALQPSPPATTMQQAMDMTAGPAAPGGLQDPSMGGGDPMAAAQGGEAAPAPAEGGDDKGSSEPAKPPSSQGQAKSAMDRAQLIGGLTGAALGGGATYLEGRSDPKVLKGKIKNLEAQKQSGKGGFGTSLALAKARLQQGLQDVSRDHPVAATAAGAALGGVQGMAAGPMVRDIAQQVRDFDKKPTLKSVMGAQ